MKNHNNDIGDIESLWMMRTNALIEYMNSYCKEIQKIESNMYKSTNTPVIRALDNVILELSKCKFRTI